MKGQILSVLECPSFRCEPDPGASFPLFFPLRLHPVAEISGIYSQNFCSHCYKDTFPCMHISVFPQSHAEVTGFAKKVILQPDAIRTFYSGTCTSSGSQHASVYFIYLSKSCCTDLIGELVAVLSLAYC